MDRRTFMGTLGGLLATLLPKVSQGTTVSKKTNPLEKLNPRRPPKDHFDPPIDGDYIEVPTYNIEESIDWMLENCQDARWDVVGRAMDVLHRNLEKEVMERPYDQYLPGRVPEKFVQLDFVAGSGCTDELLADIKAWGVDQIDEETRKEILLSDSFFAPNKMNPNGDIFLDPPECSWDEHGPLTLCWEPHEYKWVIDSVTDKLGVPEEIIASGCLPE